MTVFVTLWTSKLNKNCGFSHGKCHKDEAAILNKFALSVLAGQSTCDTEVIWNIALACLGAGT